MKGFNCYDRKGISPGIEKLYTLHAHKTGFLVPVTSGPCQREPFLARTVAELAVWSFSEGPCIATAAVFFSGFSETSGRLPVHHHPTDLRALIKPALVFFSALCVLLFGWARSLSYSPPYCERASRYKRRYRDIN